MSRNILDEVFTKLPPREPPDTNNRNEVNTFFEELANEQAYFSEADSSIDSECGLALGSHKGSFEKNKNSAYAFAAFLLAHQKGLYPPLWALNHVVSIFEEYFFEQGTTPLDELFNLRKRGDDPAFKKFLRDGLDQDLMINIWQLNIVFGISISDACYMEHRRLESTDWNGTRYGFRNFKPMTLYTIYNRVWAKVLPKKKDYDVDLLRLTDEKKQEMMSRYPQDCKIYFSGK